MLSRRALGLAVMLVGVAPADARRADALPVDSARRALFEGLPSPRDLPCAESGDAPAQIRCLLTARYRGDREATLLALRLFDLTGSVAGVLPEQDFDGGYRGLVHLVPHLPLGRDRKHLRFVVEALEQIDALLRDVERAADEPLPYRWRDLRFAFFRSVGRRTPAAFAEAWEIGYNIAGTLNHSTPGVRNLLFHEIFHLNDQAHGGWSRRTLGAIHAKIARRCGPLVDCLSQYVDGWLKVRGKTYYAFMPGNGVEEFAAELALDYQREQLAVAAGRPIAHPFKCGPPENAEAWRLLVEEFFAGVDRVPACAPPR